MSEQLPVPGKYVDDELKQLFTDTIDQLIADLGRPIVLYLTPTASGCPNCVRGFDGSSQGGYNGSNPYPAGKFNRQFPNGGVCPVCFPEDTIIMAEDGPKKIQNIQRGDIVFDKNNKKQIVHNVFYREYEGKFISLKIDGYNNFECTENHPIFVNNNKLKDAKDIFVGDYLIFPVRQFENNGIDSWFINWQQYCNRKYSQRIVNNLKFLNQNGMTKTELSRITGRDRGSIRNAIKSNISTCKFDECLKIDKDLLYLIGWYIAEGCGTHSKKINRSCIFSLSINEENVAKKLSRIIKNKFKLNSTIEKRHKTNSLYLIVNNGELSRWLSDVCGIYCYNKIIPNYLYNNLSLKDLLYLTSVIIDGDGYRRGSQEKLTTTSKLLSHQVFSILQSAGKLPGIFRRQIKNKRDFWDVTFSNNRKSHLIKRKFFNSYELREVREIHLFNKKCQVYNLEICTEHSYQANGANVGNCKGTNNILTTNSVTYTANIGRAPKDINYDAIGENPTNIYKTKTQIVAYQDILKCEKILIDGVMCTRFRDPIKTGLQTLAYVVAWWKKED